MAPYPHEETPLTDNEKAAYRYLLYQATIDIRRLCQPRLSLNPREWRRQYRNCRIAGKTANWMHNLAQCSVYDFRHFDAYWFWQEYDDLSKRFIVFRPGHWMDYRQCYNEQLTRLKTEQAA